MASNNEYKRYFIILQEDDKGYEMSPGKIPTGYVKIEVKNSKVRLNAFIQNVKAEDRIEYRLILVSSGKKLAVDVGKIIIDSSGRGELSYELESDNVLKSGLGIGDFTVAAVTAGLSLPLSGYTGRDKLEWKGKYELVNRQKAQESPRIDKKIKIEEIVPEIPAPIIPVQPVLKPELPPLKENVMKPEPNIENVMKPEPNIENVMKPQPVPPVMEHMHVHEAKVEVEVILPKCPPMAPMEEPCEFEEEPYEFKEEPCGCEEEKVECEEEKVECDDIHQYYYEEEEEEERPKHHHEEYHHKQAVSPYFSGGMYDRMKKVIRRLRKYEPFEEERGFDWFKVGDDIYEINSIAIPYMGYMVPMGYPFMGEGCSLMLDRKDYILGVKYDDREDDDDRKRITCLLFGVPALYSKKNEQYYKSRGFMHFKPHKSKGHGYFIMCLDLRSGMMCHTD